MIDIEELERDRIKNEIERLKFIDFWVDFMKKNPNHVWSAEQNRLINSLIR